MTAVAGRAGARAYGLVREDAGVARPLPFAYAAAVAALVGVATTYGLLTGPYRLVPELLAVTWVAQDAVTLAALPVLLLATRRAANGSLRAHVVAVGLQMWIAYCYLHLAVGAPLNAMFLVYVAILGLSGYAVLDGLLRVDVSAVASAFQRTPRRAASRFLLVGGIGIAALWLSDIVPAQVRGALPAGIHLAELPNPTWVFDLAWILPVSIGAAVLLRRHHPAGPLVAGTVLVALFVLSVDMLAVAPFALAAGLHGDPSVAAQLIGFTIVFGVLGAIEGWLLVIGGRRMVGVPPGWRRRGWWT